MLISENKYVWYQHLNTPWAQIGQNTLTLVMCNMHVVSIPVHETAQNLYLDKAEDVHKFTRGCFQIFSLSRIYIFIFTEDVFS